MIQTEQNVNFLFVNRQNVDRFKYRVSASDAHGDWSIGSFFLVSIVTTLRTWQRRPGSQIAAMRQERNDCAP